MIIFIAAGRLGNQMFQYAFLKNIQKNNEIIMVFGFNEIEETFYLDKKLINIDFNNKFIRKIFKVLCYKVLTRILNFLAKKKIFTVIKINYDCVNGHMRESDSLKIINGLFNFIKFVPTAYFQSEVFFKKNKKMFIIKNKFKFKAEKILNIVPKNAYKVFVHIRRGDYCAFEILGNNCLLPIEYYKNLINWFVENRKNVFFIFSGDDYKFIEENFNKINNFFILKNNHPATDLYIASTCSGAILSASSFSWWAGYLMNNKDIIFAPKYWLGFKSKIEVHKNSFPSFGIPIDILI